MYGVESGLSWPRRVVPRRSLITGSLRRLFISPWIWLSGFMQLYCTSLLCRTQICCYSKDITTRSISTVQKRDMRWMGWCVCLLSYSKNKTVTAFTVQSDQMAYQRLLSFVFIFYLVWEVLYATVLQLYWKWFPTAITIAVHSQIDKVNVKHSWVLCV